MAETKLTTRDTELTIPGLLVLAVSYFLVCGGTALLVHAVAAYTSAAH